MCFAVTLSDSTAYRTSARPRETTRSRASRRRRPTSEHCEQIRVGPDDAMGVVADIANFIRESNGRRSQARIKHREEPLYRRIGEMRQLVGHVMPGLPAGG